MVNKPDMFDDSDTAARERAEHKVHDEFVLVDNREQAQFEELKKFMAKVTCSKLFDNVKDAWE